ncbi:hypothetical protein BTE54_16145 [Agrobacterium sp. YIC 4121]|nr:hypothetical protein BTE54_16145 [Agrobacterium sp. YIC 4121]
MVPPSFLCLSQESSWRASARRRESFQPKDLGWLDLCDKHRDEGDNGILKCRSRKFGTCLTFTSMALPDEILRHALDSIMIRDMFCEI